jgi:hypothetical protein
LSLFSGGTGVLTPAALLVSAVILCVSRHLPWHKAASTLVAAGAICCLGFYLRINVPEHEYLKAKTLASFFHVLSTCLAWPNIDQPLTAVVMYLPVFVYGLIGVGHRNRFVRRDLVLVWLPALLGGLTAASIAYARGNGLPNGAPLSRYQEMLAVGAIANGCAVLLLRPTEASPRCRRSWLLLCVIWCTLFVMGATRLSMANFITHLPFKAASGRCETALLTSYTKTHDISILEGRSLYEIGYTDAQVIQQVIENHDLAPVLPTILQPSAKPTVIESASHLLLRMSPGIFLVSLVLLVLANALEYPRAKQST